MFKPRSPEKPLLSAGRCARWAARGSWSRMAFDDRVAWKCRENHQSILCFPKCLLALLFFFFNVKLLYICISVIVYLFCPFWCSTIPITITHSDLLIIWFVQNCVSFVFYWVLQSGNHLLTIFSLYLCPSGLVLFVHLKVESNVFCESPRSLNLSVAWSNSVRQRQSMALSYLLLICYRQNSLFLFYYVCGTMDFPLFPLRCPPKARFSNMNWTMLQVLVGNIPHYKKERLLLMRALMVLVGVTVQGAPSPARNQNTSFALALDLWRDRKKPSIYYILNELLPKQKQRG